MSAQSGSERPGARNGFFRWRDGSLEPLDNRDPTGSAVAAADSWLVDDGRVLAIDLHRRRFAAAVASTSLDVEIDDFWVAVLARTPASGTWFPRVDLLDRDGSPVLTYRHRMAPERKRSAVLATAAGRDPRKSPRIKGPDLEALARLRSTVQSTGADEAVICSPEGYVVEGAYSTMLWWRGETLCAPSPELDRVDSVTASSVITLATALGIDVAYESVTPAELDGLEIWAGSALHGIRIATAWVDGPRPAESPGRLALWRERLGRLSRPIDTLDQWATH